MGSERQTNRGLFGHTRSALLATLYGHSEEWFHLRQLARLAGAGYGAVQRELKSLTEMGLVLRRSHGNQVLYCANHESPIFAEIRSLVAKTVGIHNILHSALTRFGSQIKIAFVYGSVARQQERPGSDVDLMILGEVDFGDLIGALGEAQQLAGREINPTVFPLPEFRSKLAKRNHFLETVMKDKKLFIVGNEHELGELAARQLAGTTREQR